MPTQETLMPAVTENTAADTVLTKTVSNTYIQAATSNNTRKAYQSDIRHFMASGGLLPATAEQILSYLHQFADTLNPRTLERRLTAIKQWHLLQGFSDPTSNPLIRKTLTGIKNVHGKPKEKATALTLPALKKIISHLNLSATLIDRRNSALIQIGFFGAFRRSELVSIRWEDVTFSDAGVEILIRQSKTDQAGEGQFCAIPYGDQFLCPVSALKAWHDSCAVDTGFVFRAFNKANNLMQDNIKPGQLSLIIKQVAQHVGLTNPAGYSSHSLRRGFATEAARKGAPFGSIMRQGRWRHEGTVLGYMDEGKRFEQNAASSLFKD